MTPVQNRERNRLWREMNPDKVVAQNKKWYAENRERELQRNREWRLANKQKRDAYMKIWNNKQRSDPATAKEITARAAAWKAANPDRNAVLKRTAKRARQTRKLRSLGTYSFPKFIARCEYFGWLCRYCGRKLSRATVTEDHQIPLSRGGSQWPSNLVPACSGCNNKKHARKPSEWATFRLLDSSL